MNEGLDLQYPIVAPLLDNYEDEIHQQGHIVHDGAQAELRKKCLGGAHPLSPNGAVHAGCASGYRPRGEEPSDGGGDFAHAHARGQNDSTTI